MTYYEKIREGSHYVKDKIQGVTPDVAIVLGSGLSALVEKIKVEVCIPYKEIPHLESSSVVGHGNEMVYGSIGDKKVLVMVSRIHFYEGYSMEAVTFPIRLFTAMGIKNLILTNAAGGMKGTPGQLNVITDHLSYFCPSPLRGTNIDELGVRFPDATAIYTPSLREVAKKVAKEQGINLGEGVYAYMTGPMYETPAEIKGLSTLGGDMVGMSTVPEAIVAAHGGLNVLGISCITNMAAGISGNPLNHEEVIETTKKVEEDFKALIYHIVEAL